MREKLLQFRLLKRLVQSKTALYNNTWVAGKRYRLPGRGYYWLVYIK